MAKNRNRTKRLDNSVQNKPNFTMPQLTNSLPELTELLLLSAGQGGALAPSNGLDQLFYNNRYVILANYRQAISAAYMTNGLVQKFIDIPVDDGFRYGFKLKSKSLGEDRCREILQYFDHNNIMETITSAKKWGRLYGGGGIIINCGQDPTKPLNMNLINKNTPLKFIAADLWELAKHDENKPDSWEDDQTDVPYNYYGNSLHKSMVIKIMGKEATSWDRPRIRMWGMSELERIMPELNSHMRAIDLIFELLNQYKIDVWKIKDYNSNLMNSDGTKMVDARIQHANRVKGYLNAVIMDVEDDFMQKQCHFSGLAEILNEIRKGLACVLNIPMTKLFGLSAAGFNAGDDDLENYNCMIEHEIRAKSKYMIIQILQIICKKLYGFVPEDLEINWKSLRILTAEQEENVKNSQCQRIISLFNNGLITSQEAILSINIQDLAGVEVEEKEVITIEQQQMLQDKENNDTIDKGSASSKMKDETYLKRYGHNRELKEDKKI